MENDNGFEQINPDEIDLNEIPEDEFNTVLNDDDAKFIQNLYYKHHGSSPRFPGGNCVFASILTFMSYEKIDNMINYVLTKQKELNNEQLNDIIVQIFKNTPRTKNRDIISYMRAYVYIYLVENLGEYFKIGGINSQLTNLVNGGYTFIDQYTMQAFCAMTGQNILVFKDNNNKKLQPILCSIDKNKYYSFEKISRYPSPSEYTKTLLYLNDDDNFYVRNLSCSSEENGPTISSAKFDGNDTISIFCFGNHCTPFVGKQNVHFFYRLGAKKINTSKIENFVPRDFIMKKQFDVPKKDIMQKNDKLNWKTIFAITTGIVFAIGVSIVSAFTFGLGLIPALLATKIAIGLGTAFSLASFIYPIFTTIKNKKNKKQDSINLSITPLLDDNGNLINDESKKNKNMLSNIHNLTSDSDEHIPPLESKQNQLNIFH